MITVSLPPALVVESEKVAKKKHMTRSELMRTALRIYLEEQALDEAIRVGEEELRLGKLKVLPVGGLAKLMRKK